MKTLLAILISCTVLAGPSFAAFPPSSNEVVFADFEGTNWGDWKVTGDAFGPAPARGTLPGQQSVSGFQGRGFVNSYVGGDKATGTLTSAEFTIDKPYLSFLLGGGNHPGEACVNLVVDGKVARTATASEGERLVWHTWNLFALSRKKARIEIVDKHTGGWGHINVDQIVMSDRPRVHVFFNDAVSRAMAHVEEAVPRADADPTRPVFHFAAPGYWMNDPNGPFYNKGYYHIYYQHNPFGDAWGHMHWGHARSRDLVYWKYLPIALWPSKESGEDHVFSGCTTTNARGEILSFYTSIGRGKSATDYAEQWAATADPEANVFAKHPANPILSEKLHGETKVYDWRDPFVFRDNGKVFMVCGGNLNRGKGGEGVVLLYEAGSGELTNWNYRGVLFKHPDKSVVNIECPNFFKLGDRWVLIVSPHRKVEYFTGSFDAAAGKFTAQQRGLMDHSDNYYAPNCMEDPEGRRVLWGWVRGFKEGRGWNGCFTLPRILTIGSDGHLRQAPAPALEKLRQQPFQLTGVELTNATNALQNVTGNQIEIAAEFEPATAKNFGLRLRVSEDSARAIQISCDGRMLDVAGAKAPLPEEQQGKALRLQVFLDRSVLEVYVNGRQCFTRVVYPGERDLGLGLFASGGSVRVKSLAVWPMGDIGKGI